jgi:hypothetical protein
MADSMDFNNNPNNFNNSPLNFENSPDNFKNSPNNFENSPNRFGNDNIVRDNEGNAIGYEVEKRDGGVNFFNLSGERQGYKAGN